MNTRVAIITFAILLSVGTACTFHVGAFAPSTVINQNNFRVVGQVEASESATYILMIGGNKQEQIFKKLKATLYEKAGLKEGQALANMSVDIAIKTVFTFYTKQTYTMTADIVDFN